MTDQDSRSTVTVQVPRREGLVFRLQRLEGTDVWAVVEQGDFQQLVEKAKLYDMESHDRLSYEASKLSRDLALERPIGLTEMVMAAENSRSQGVVRTSAWRDLK